MNMKYICILSEF